MNTVQAATLDMRLHGSFMHRWRQDLFTNTLHFPIANILLELISDGWRVYLSEPDIYILLSACIVQSALLAGSHLRLQAWPLLGNLIAPGLYSAAEIFIEPEANFFALPNHIAYWGIALGIGLMQQGRLWLPRWATLWTLLESMIRASILLLMYWIFGMLNEGKYYSFAGFFEDNSHVFLGLTTLLFGLLLGMAQNSANAYLSLLRDTSHQLRCYSEWLLGRERLAQAVDDPDALSLSRCERTVLFMDIRGFTAWSEPQTPETVVEMINQYCETAEQCWQQNGVIKAKLTGDEIMIVFADANVALQTAYCLRQQVGDLLRVYQLGVGIGIHTGALVEGLLGSSQVKAYDIIGDTVNTAKRLCDHAARGEILLSQATAEALSSMPDGESCQVQAKGKSEEIRALRILSNSL